MAEERKESLNFIAEIIERDIKEGKHEGRVHTRFPPEPNGYLHIGHAKAIWISFGMAKKYGGLTNLRFDDTNPVTEETEYVNAIKSDIRWLGYDWDDREYFASDYFDQLYAFAEKLIAKGLAYVDHSTAEEMATAKGTPFVPATPSPYRDRSVEENMELFRKMREAQFPDGTCVLRAKVDLNSPNMLMRDPIIYRIKHAHHHRTGDKWCIYPMYDFAHGQSDSIEKITHSLCSLEFIHHRPLYDWFIENLDIFPSKQYEFARMNVTYMLTSKRKLLKLVQDGYVTGWDDPRMPTLSGLRRRGVPPASIIAFCEKTGVAKRDVLLEIELLDSCIREELNKISQRVMVVKEPLKLSIINYPEGEFEMLKAENNPEDESAGHRELRFSKNLYIEQEDFMEDAPSKYFRMTPGKNVRLKHAYILKCEDVIKDKSGRVVEVLASYCENSKSGEDSSGIKAKGTLHWVCADDAVACELRDYDRLFTDPTPADYEDKDFLDFINPDSLKIYDQVLMEPGLLDSKPGAHFQFLRNGYYTKDIESTSEKNIFNLTIPLKDSWAKTNK
jgi:glutaminyl-tRNA synthetase